jgi:hypothetical protein
MTADELRVLDDLIQAADKARPILDKYKRDKRYTQFSITYGTKKDLKKSVVFEAGTKLIKL